MGTFTGRAAIVTGASSGIGRSIAVTLGRAGADLWLVGRSVDELNATAALIAEAGGPAARIAPMNLRERGPLANLVNEVSAAHPHLFALVNNAGVMHPEPIMEGTIDRWQAMFDINVMAMLEGSQAAIGVMRRHGRPGHLINIGSIASRFPVPGVYGASKQAVNAIGESLRAEIEQDDIRVTTIIPGGFVSNLAQGFTPQSLAGLMESFEAQGLSMGGPGSERVLSDPQQLADLVRYILEQPININIQEVVIRPPVNTNV